MEQKRYAILYADPAWQYLNKGRGAADNHYPTMSTQDICALPVSGITADNCVLFLWATFPNLPEAFKVIAAWGFMYKTVAFVLLKRNRKSLGWFWGMGYWTRSNAEVCLLAVKGKPRRISRSVHQVIETPIQPHSQKPDEARSRIIQLVGDLPRIELFARTHAPGWDVWGNEVESSIALC